MTENPNTVELLELTTEIVSAHVGNNTVAIGDLPSVIQEVYKALQSVGRDQGAPERPRPAVSIKKSITADYIICLEDGKKMKMLKRHLRTTFDMTPEDYKAKWGLPSDYPMVAPNYAKKRSEFAKKIGLGKGSGKKK